MLKYSFYMNFALLFLLRLLNIINNGSFPDKDLFSYDGNLIIIHLKDLEIAT